VATDADDQREFHYVQFPSYQWTILENIRGPQSDPYWSLLLRLRIPSRDYYPWTMDECCDAERCRARSPRQSSCISNYKYPLSVPWLCSHRYDVNFVGYCPVMNSFGGPRTRPNWPRFAFLHNMSFSHNFQCYIGTCPQWQLNWIGLLLAYWCVYPYTIWHVHITLSVTWHRFSISLNNCGSSTGAEVIEIIMMLGCHVFPFHQRTCTTCSNANRQSFALQSLSMNPN
jgi:hypothetical protein